MELALSFCSEIALRLFVIVLSDATFELGADVVKPMPQWRFVTAFRS